MSEEKVRLDKYVSEIFLNVKNIIFYSLNGIQTEKICFVKCKSTHDKMMVQLSYTPDFSSVMSLFYNVI